MRIDSTLQQQQVMNLQAKSAGEVPGEAENDGDSDDGAKTASVSKTLAASQVYAQGVGTKVDFFA